MRRLLFFILIIGIQLFSTVEAQDFSASEIVTIEGKKYILHLVSKGETIFSICQRYEVDQKDLVAANPQLIFGLKEGDSLKVPYQAEIIQKATPSPNVQTEKTEFIYHVVKKSETVYSISRQYNVPFASIYQYNPESKNELLENEIILIPKQLSDTKTDGLIREDSSYYYHQIQAQETPYSLARRYHSNVNDILTLNNLAVENFNAGLIIRIPKAHVQTAGERSANETGEYFMHRIEQGDTFYSYQRRFGVTQEQLVALNPALKEGLLAGLIIKVPASKIQQVEVIPVVADNFIKHHVVAGENLFSLSRQYEINVLNIRELNPELKNRGLIAGEIVLIPKITESITYQSDTPGRGIVLPEVLFEVVKKPEPDYRKDYTIQKDDTFRISMFLPLFFNINESQNSFSRSGNDTARLDSLKKYDKSILEKYYRIETNRMGVPVDTVLIDNLEKREERSLYQHSRPFVYFYQGFLLALDSMQKAGVNIRLDLYDSENDPKVIDKALHNSDFINTDLIVGPVDVRLQTKLSAFSYKNQIPMVSPLSSNEEVLLKNPFYFQINPSKSYVIRKTSDFIGDAFHNKNFIIMTLGSVGDLSESDLVGLVRDKFFSSGVYNNLGEVLFSQVDFTGGGNLGYWQVKRTLKPNMENVIFIPATENRSEREALLSRAINSLHVLSEEFDITLVGVSDYPQFKSINTEYFHKLKLHYLTSNHVDYTAMNVKEFIGKYRNNFSNEPDQYSYRGYDLGMFFIGAYSKYGKNFVENVGSYNPDLLQGTFNFQKVDQFSGYMNHTLYVMQFTPSYEVKVISKVTEGRIAF